MECDRLKRLVKKWYAQVQDETMAPARMVAFMRQHVADCATCLNDPFVRPEIEKITAIIIPPDKPVAPVDKEPSKDAAAKDPAEDSAEDPAEDEEVNDDEEEKEEEEDDY